MSLRPVHLLPAGSREEHEPSASTSLGMSHLPQRHEGFDPRQQPPPHFPRRRRGSLIADPRAYSRIGLPHEHKDEPEGGCWSESLGPERLGHVCWRPMGW